MLYAIHQQEKTNSKYIKEYDTDKELSCIMYWDISNLYGWVMSQNLPVGGFEWQYERDFDEDYIRNYDDEDSDKGYNLEVDVKYLKKLHKLHNLLFSFKRMEFHKCQKKLCVL